MDVRARADSTAGFDAPSYRPPYTFYNVVVFSESIGYYKLEVRKRSGPTSAKKRARPHTISAI